MRTNDSANTPGVGLKPCIVIPVYNNRVTVVDVVRRAMATGLHVIVVNDGSTDGSGEAVENECPEASIVDYRINRGKGYALQCGLDMARCMGYTHAVTMDADGQHYPEDAAGLLVVSRRHPGVIVFGSRGSHDGYKSAGSRFANRFSNFWFSLQTLTRGIDTQCGYRCYPLTGPRIRFYTSRYEAELAAPVSARWRGVGLTTAPVRVYYPPASDRVSHFRPARDFARISLLNTLLCLLAVIYGYPSMFYHKIKGLCSRYGS